MTDNPDMIEISKIIGRMKKEAFHRMEGFVDQYFFCQLKKQQLERKGVVVPKELDEQIEIQKQAVAECLFFQ